MKDTIRLLQEAIIEKEAELQALHNSLEVVLRANEAACTHPRLKRTPYEHDCPDCSYYRERSF